MALLGNVMQVMKENNVMGELKDRGIRNARDGRELNELTYKELIVELALARVSDTKVEHPSNEWF